MKDIFMENLLDFMSQKRKGTIHGRSGIGTYWSFRGRIKREHAQSWTQDMDNTILKLQKVCAVCAGTQNLAIDHVMPLSRGGKLEPGNVVMLCQPCNSKKSYKKLEDLDRTFVDKILKGAKQFKDYWDGVKIENTR